jgi:hypothetical protein
MEFIWMELELKAAGDTNIFGRPIYLAKNFASL